MTKQGFGQLKSLPEAKKIMAELVKEVGSEDVLLSDCLGRVLAEDIVSPLDVPHFMKSAMDGFAVRAEDTFGASQTNPKTFKIMDSVTAGVVSKKVVETGACIEITTGAPLPKGADSVVMVEYTEKGDGTVTIYKASAPGDNTIKIGSDVKKGEAVLKKGTKLTPQKIGVMSSLGITKVKAKKVPTIAYFSSGNEVQMPGEALSSGKIYDINSATITNAIKANGCRLIDLGIAKDSLDDIKERVKKGVGQADITLLSGGSSLGGEDFMVEAVAQLGKVLVHGIAVKPGKPVLVGEVKGKLVLGLPGYPTSALSNFYILVVPLINRLLGRSEEPVYVEKKLSRKIASTIGRYEFLAVKISGGYAEPVLKGSSSITTLATADGFLELDENTEVVSKDDTVRVRLL